MASGDAASNQFRRLLQLDHVRLAAAEGNGLFTKERNTEEHKALLQSLEVAAQGLDPRPTAPDQKTPHPDPAAAAKELHEFEKTFYEAQKNAGLWWRVNYSYALIPFLYLTIFALLVFLLYHETYAGFADITGLSVRNASVWGLIGGLAQGYYWLFQQVSDNTYRSQWVFWVLSLPVAGAIFGGLAFLLVVGGLVPLVSSGNATPNSFGVMVFAGWAGFSWMSFVGLLKKIIGGSGSGKG